jgi:alkanesulfonate monooxygenase SsuD/methylene tetrahydromethanopterin reductase-like flavin-dependent oxidoreductase (luciferase family)
MELGLFTEPQVGGSYDDIHRLASWAESIGLDVFARSDHYLNMDESAASTDAMATLAGLARDTERIQLAVLVAPLTFRHPAVMAKTAATIDQMSGGRMALGVGTGWMQTEHDEFGLELPAMKERFERLFEALAYLRASFDAGATGFSGRHYRLGTIDVLPKPIHLPLIVGGAGPRKTPTIAGRFADEYNSFAGRLDSLPARLDVMRRAAEDVGREPGAIKISLAGSVVVGADRADYDERAAERAAGRDMSPGEYETFLTERHVPHGTAEQAAETVAGYAVAGVDRFYLQEFTALPEIDTDLLGDVFAAMRG